MRKFHELSDDDPVWSAHVPLTVGSVSKAAADAKGALASTRELADRVDDVDALIDGVRKSVATLRAALSDPVSKAAKVDTSAAVAALAKRLDAFEKSFHARQHAASGSTVDLETYMTQVEGEREMYRKRDELTKYDYDDDGKIAVARLPGSSWKVIR